MREIHHSMVNLAGALAMSLGSMFVPVPEQPPSYGRRPKMKRRDTRSRSGFKYKGSTAAKRASRRGGNPAAHR